jgi:hypothetical protein
MKVRAIAIPVRIPDVAFQQRADVFLRGAGKPFMDSV